MKKIICIALLFLMLFVAGCGNTDVTTAETAKSKTSDYSIINEAGEDYIVFSDEYMAALYANSDGVHFMEQGYLEFVSLDEFKSAVVDNKMTSKDKRFVAENFYKDEGGKIKICDFNNLQELVLPEHFEVGGVDWRCNGEEYLLHFKSIDEQKSGYVLFMPPENYEESYNDVYESIYANRLVEIDKFERSEDRNSEIIYYTTRTAKLKTILYTLEFDGMKFLVSEDYTLWASPEVESLLPEASDSVPVSVKIHGEKGEHRFKISFRGLTERPSVEFLKSFGIKKFEG